MDITAKAKVKVAAVAYLNQDSTVVPQGDSSATHAVLTFQPDYAEGRNEEWAINTPTMSLSMNVTLVVADQFRAGTPYTLTFTPEEIDSNG